MAARPEELIHKVVAMAAENVHAGGGPFAALVVCQGEVVAAGTNQVTATNDPTAHAEVTAIRQACRILGAFQLENCELYTSCEPCPMCLGAIYWAQLGRVYYAATQRDAADAGFDDAFIYREIELAPPERRIPMLRMEMEGAALPFRVWKESADKQKY